AISSRPLRAPSSSLILCNRSPHFFVVSLACVTVWSLACRHTGYKRPRWHLHLLRQSKRSEILEASTGMTKVRSHRRPLPVRPRRAQQAARLPRTVDQLIVP
ncbi:hypothetical protein LTR56_028026, partial [Elasticomyces elasticus]